MGGGCWYISLVKIRTLPRNKRTEWDDSEQIKTSMTARVNDQPVAGADTSDANWLVLQDTGPVLEAKKRWWARAPDGRGGEIETVGNRASVRR